MTDDDNVIDCDPATGAPLVTDAGGRTADRAMVQGGRTADLVVTPHPLTLDGRTALQRVPLRPGESLAAFLARAGVDLGHGHWVVALSGHQVPRSMWARTRPHDGQLVEVRRIAGRGALRFIATAALFVFSGGNPWVFLIGRTVINRLLAPRPQNKQYDQATGTTYTVSGGRNRMRPFEPLGLLFGSVRVVPDYASAPYTWFEGEDQIMSARFNAGINVGGVSSIKIGETAIESYQDVDVRTTGFPGTTTLLLDWSNVDSIAGGTLTAPTAPGAYTVRTSSAGTTLMAADFEAQLYKMDGGGKFLDATVNINLEYRLLPAGPWTPFGRLLGVPFFDTVTLTSKSTKPVRRTVLTANLAPGQYEVRARKMTADVATAQEANAVAWVALKSFQAEAAPLTGYPQVGVRIKASGQLNGALDELSWVAFQAAAPRWTGTAWVTEPNSNPGSHMLAFARGFYDGDGRLMAGMGLPDDQIDIEGLKAFMVHCSTKGLRFDHWFDAQVSCYEVLEAMAAAGHGSFSQHTGHQVSVVWDSADDAVEHVVNMGNIKATTFRVDYDTRPVVDEMEATCFNAADGWRSVTVRLMAPGVTAPTETVRFAPIGQTTVAGLVDAARFAFGQRLYHRKGVSWEMDLEALEFRRRSLIALSHDLTQWGYSGRLHSAVDVAGTVTLTLDAEVPFNAAATLRRVGLRLPGETGMRVFSVAAFSGTTHTLTLASAWPAGVPLPGSTPANPAHDTLWVWDFKATPGQRLRVVSIEPAANLGGAKITAVPETDEFWTYVATGTYTVPPSTVVTEPLVVTNVQAHQSRNAINYDETALLALTFDVSGPYDHAQVWAAEAGAALQLVGETRTRAFPPTPVWGGVTYNIEVRPFDGLGRLGTVASTSHTVVLDVLTGAAGNYTSFIFKRAATQPATPTGNTPAGWFDGPPANDGNPLWVSIGEFDAANELLGAWSTPVQIDGESLQVEYSVDGTGGWHTEVTTADFWARYRIGTTGPWSVPVKFRGEDGRDAVLLLLTASSFYFVFESEFATESTDPPITFVARRVNLTGTVTWTAKSYTSAGVELGNITLTGSGDTRQLTAAAFNGLGTGLNTHHAIVTAQVGTLPPEEWKVTRTNLGSAAPEMSLSNPSHPLPASEAGVVTSYIGAGGTATAYQGQMLLSDTTTPSVVFAIAPGGNPAGLTASIDPVTGVYAVTGMPDNILTATLTLQATYSTGTVLTAPFKLFKSMPGASAVVHAFEPRSEIILPIDSAGNVLSFDLAWTDFVSRQGTGLATGWALSKVDANCTSTLTGTRIQITAMGTLGQGALGPVVDLTTQRAAVGMTNGTRYMAWDGVKWWISGSEAGGTAATITGFITTADMLAYTAVSCGVSGRWTMLCAGAGKVVFFEDLSSSRVLYTADGGATFALAALPAARTIYDVKFGDRFMMWPNGSTTGYRSTDGVTWTAFTTPVSGIRNLAPGDGAHWMAWGNTDAYLSTNGGDSWTQVLGGAAGGIPPLGAVVGMIRFRGRWVAALQSGGLLVSATGAAGSWVRVTPEAPLVVTFAFMLKVSGVLYLVCGDGAIGSRILYTTDGVTFRAGAVLASTQATNFMLWCQAPEVPINYLPWNSSRRYLLSATSDTEGSVAVTATKGSESVTRSLRVAKGTPAALSSYLFAATPGTLLIPTTADGVWLDAAAKSVTAAALKDGADNSSAWTASWVASAGITPSSGTGFTASITAMTVDTGTLTFTLFSAGLPVITGVVSVQKTKGADTSGFKVGTAALPIVHEVASSGSIAFKVTTDGRVMVSRNGAAYTLLVPWYWPITAGIGTNVFFRMTGTGDAVSGDATGSWLQANVDRIWTLSRGTFGVSTWNFQLDLSSPTAGANAISAQGSLKLTIL